MKIREIIKSKVPLYTKEKYFDLFIEIICNLKSILKKDNKSKIKLIFSEDFFQDEKNNIINNNSIKENCMKYIQKLENSILKNIYYNGKKLSEIEYLYLKHLAKEYKKRLDLISIQNKQKKEYTLNIYIQLCQNQILLINNLKNKRKSIKLKKICKNLSFQERRNNLLKINEHQLTNFSEEEEKKNVNLFIGKFNMKKFLDKEQIIELKKGDFVNAYIFKNKFDKLKGRPFIFRQNSILNKKKQRFTNNGLPVYYGKKGKINVHRLSSIAIDKYSVPISLIREIRKQKELEDKKLKKNAFSSHNFKINEPEFNNIEKKSIECYTNRQSVKIHNNNLINKYNFEGHIYSKNNFSARNINNKGTRNKISLRSYLSKEDLYY